MAFAGMSSLSTTQTTKDLNESSNQQIRPSCFIFTNSNKSWANQKLEAYLGYEAYDHTQSQENSYSALSFLWVNGAHFTKLS